MKGTIAVLGVMLVLVLVFYAPFITIASVNTLFGTGIPYTLGTYFAAFWLHIIIGSSTVSLKGKGE